jgi:hypothetical protein
MERICWNCKYFQANDSGGDYPNGGICRRYAPKGRDTNGLAANRRFMEMQFGIVNETIYKAANSPLPLFLAQQATGALPSIAAAGGYNGNGIWPCLNDGNWMLETITLRCSLANTGADTVVNPKFQVEVYRVNGTDITLYHTIDLDPGSGDPIGTEGDTDDAFCRAFSENLYPDNATGLHCPAFGGFAIKLTDDDPGLVGEIRNPIIGVLMSRYINAITNATFPYMQRGDSMQCGDWVPNPGSIPALP